MHVKVGMYQVQVSGFEPDLLAFILTMEGQNPNQTRLHLQPVRAEKRRHIIFFGLSSVCVH